MQTLASVKIDFVQKFQAFWKLKMSDHSKPIVLATALAQWRLKNGKEPSVNYTSFFSQICQQSIMFLSICRECSSLYKKLWGTVNKLSDSEPWDWLESKPCLLLAYQLCDFKFLIRLETLVSSARHRHHDVFSDVMSSQCIAIRMHQDKKTDDIAKRW